MRAIMHLRTGLWAMGLLIPCLLPGALRGGEPAVLASDRIAAAEAFADQFVSGNYAAMVGSFDTTMRAALSIEGLSSLHAGLEAQLGAFKQRTGSRAGKIQQYDMVLVTLEYEKMPIDMEVVFAPSGQVTGLYFLTSQPPAYTPPTYVDVNAFHEQDVTVGSGEWALPGTLTLPEGPGSFPAVVLAHGSGPNDRDETIGPNKPFRDMAWGLASRGIAVLRYEKRTRQHAAKFTAERVAKLTVKEETIDDVLLAAALLRKTPSIAPARVHVLGHSLGGYLLPRIGAADPNITSLISMAGPTRPMEDLIVEQITYICALDDTISVEEQASLDALAVQAARVKDPNLSAATPASLLLGAPACYWLDLRGYAPANAAKSLAMPMLFLQGGRDYQVTMADLEGWRSALASQPDVEFRVYPDLNHAFIAGTGKCTPAEYDILGHVAEQVVMDVAAWVLRSASR